LLIFSFSSSSLSPPFVLGFALAAAPPSPDGCSSSLGAI